MRGNNGGMNDVSLSTKFKVWFESIPFTTRILFSLCTSIHILGYIFGAYTSTVCLQPMQIMYLHQVYRLITNAYFHNGILHLVFNMMAFLPLGGDLERRLGSAPFMWLLAVFNVLCGLCHFTLSVLPYYVWGYGDWMNECSIGYSGILFAMMVVDLPQNPSSDSTRSIFGVIRVPVMWYPWVLLIVLQLFFSSISFLGHLSGILVGYAYRFGWLEWVIPLGFLKSVESSSWSLVRSAVNSNGYINMTVPHSNSDQDSVFNRMFSYLPSPPSSILPTVSPTPSSRQAFSGAGRVLGTGALVSSSSSSTPNINDNNRSSGINSSSSNNVHTGHFT